MIPPKRNAWDMSSYPSIPVWGYSSVQSVSPPTRQSSEDKDDEYGPKFLLPDVGFKFNSCLLSKAEVPFSQHRLVNFSIQMEEMVATSLFSAITKIPDGRKEKNNKIMPWQLVKSRK